jgi:hypothetical protein
MNFAFHLANMGLTLLKKIVISHQPNIPAGCDYNFHKKGLHEPSSCFRNHSL